MKRAVKYCGGCNPRYDRVAAVRKLEARLGEKLPAAQPGEDYDQLFVIYGCTSKCADVSQLAARELVWVTTDCMDV